MFGGAVLDFTELGDEAVSQDSTGIESRDLGPYWPGLPRAAARANALERDFLSQRGGPYVTVCIAAICNNGANLIYATDGMLSDSGTAVTGDVLASKLLFLDNWAFMLAGSLSNGDLILEELRLMAVQSKGGIKLARETVRRLLPKAYRLQLSNWLAERWLSQYDMDMGEFKKRGLVELGEKRYLELTASMEQDTAANFDESVLLGGWGAAPHSACIFALDRLGFSSHTLTGFATIGSGGAVAMSTLMQVCRGRHMPTEDALYAVASAKFAAESCSGVGKDTTICIAHKQKRPVLLQLPHLAELRRIWEQHGRPKIPKSTVLTQIARELGVETNEGVFREIQRAVRTGKGPRPIARPKSNST